MTECLQEKVTIDGPRGQLAGELNYPAGSAGAAVVILNPHPHMGGRMEHPLVVALAAEAAQQGLISLRFDYAGVGASEGPRIDVAASMQAFWEDGRTSADDDMIDDGRAAQLWLMKTADTPVALIGYSFGAMVAVRIADETTPKLVLIAPAPERHDLTAARDVSAPMLIVHGDGDFATEDDAMANWIADLPTGTESRHFVGAGHFFRGVASEVAASSIDFINGAAQTPAGEQR